MAHMFKQDIANIELEEAFQTGTFEFNATADIADVVNSEEPFAHLGSFHSAIWDDVIPIGLKFFRTPPLEVDYKTILDKLKLPNIWEKTLQYSAARAMMQIFEDVNPEISLQSLVYKMREKGYSILPVFEESRLIGVVDINMVNNFLKLQKKLS